MMTVIAHYTAAAGAVRELLAQAPSRSSGGHDTSGRNVETDIVAPVTARSWTVFGPAV
jgi:hypothetical protein